MLDFFIQLKKLLKESKATLLGALSCMFEWYDYALFGYFTTILSRLFFPCENFNVALLSGFAVFASGFIMRPLGSILFGYIGDKISRKHALMLSLFAMAFPTVLLGCIPTFQHIGFTATALLVILRLLQGLAVGGNYGGSFIFTIENAPKGQQALAGSLATFGTLGGLLLGSTAAYLTTTLFTSDQLLEYGWRIPFLLAGLSSVVALKIRTFLPTTSEEQNKLKTLQSDVKDDNHAKPNETKLLEESSALIKTILNSFRSHFIKAIAIILIDGVGVYLALVFMTTYATQFLHFDQSIVFLMNTLAMGVLVIFIPIFGYLADKIGARRIISRVALGLLLFSLPAFIVVAASKNIYVFCFVQFVFALLIAAAYGTLPVIITGIFPHHIRYTATGLAFNISVALFGGTAPLVVTYLLQTTNYLWIPGGVLSIVGLASYSAIRRLETNYL